MINENLKVEDFEISSRFLLDELPQRRCVINTINAYSWVMTNTNPTFKEALRTSDVLLPDGVGVVIAARLLAGAQIHKIAGADLHRLLLELLERKGGRCFYLGAAETTLEKIKRRLSVEYPSIKVGTFSPPYKAEFSEEDNREMIARIQAFAPDVVFVGMTAPKQETWIYRNHASIDTSVICGIGAVFDFYAGTKKRPPRWMIRLGLEWFGRLISEPRRMWKRYIVYNCVFLYDIFRRYARKRS